MTKSIFDLMTMPVRTDSYKISQWKQYPPDTTHISSYVESRGGADKTVFFGPQAFIKEYMLKPLQADEAEFMYRMGTQHGEPVNKDGWKHIINKYGGYAPVHIEAVPEGTYMNTKNVQSQLINDDPLTHWVTSYIETAYLRSIWYPSSVATRSRMIKVMLAKAIEKSSDIPMADQIAFKLHDFGARGASSTETAILGGMSHLVNFMGTDTFEGMIGAYHFYNADVAGFSIPASEHSTITSWGQENEIEAYKNMIEQFGGPDQIYACVSDSYNIWKAIEMWGSLNDQILAKGGTLVIRPDSGDPMTVPVKVIEKCMDVFGYTINSKGYKVLPPHIRVIQGDGIYINTIDVLINNILDAKFSIENIAFGMGGGLLQDVTRDTFKYAMKASARKDTNGDWHDVFKDPIDDKGKTSKKGRMGLIESCGFGGCEYRTVPHFVAKERGNIIRPIYAPGELLVDDNFSTIRERAEVQTHEYKEQELVGMYD